MNEDGSQTEPNRKRTLVVLGTIALVLFLGGFLIHVFAKGTEDAGWAMQASLTGVVTVIAIAAIGILGGGLAPRLRFHPRVSGAIVMSGCMTLLHLTFHFLGFGDETLPKVIGNAAVLGAIVGVAVGPQLQKHRQN